MGVTYLQSFMHKKVPNGVNEVDMKEEVNKYKQKYGSGPTIIIDVLAFKDRMHTNDHEILLGGRSNVYSDRAADFFGKIKDLGVNLIFFADGPPQIVKLSTYFDRRNQHYYNGVNILQAIDDGIDISQPIPDLKIENLGSFLENFISIASKFGEIHVSTLNECDLELSNLASKLNALAIISNDTDFLIFKGDWRYWNSTDFDLDNLTTIEYNRKSLRTFLDLSDDQMALLATLSGNDIVKHASLQNFHNNIAPHAFSKLPAIANLVRNLRSAPPYMSKTDMDYLVKKIYSYAESKTGYDLIRSSLNSYNYNSMKTTHGDDLLDKISKNTNGFNFIVLGNIQYIFRLSYIDLLTTEFTSFYELAMELIRPQMGILLDHLNDPKVTRIFYAKKTHEAPYRRYEERPEYPEIKVPPIDRLLFTPIGNDEDLDNTRWNLLCWQISSKLNPLIVKEIPKDNLITVLTIFHLFEKKQITTSEADCLILANNCPDEVHQILKLDHMKRINGRDARLAFLFPRFYGFIINCFNAVGLGSFCSMITFDGLYFHVLRNKWRTQYNKSKRAKEMLNYKNLRLYSEDFGLL